MAQEINVLLIPTDELHPAVAGFSGDDVFDTGHLDCVAERKEGAS